MTKFYYILTFPDFFEKSVNSFPGVVKLVYLKKHKGLTLS